MNVDIVILAAGQGTRMKSKLPKVIHSLAGKPMLEHVMLAAQHAMQQQDQRQLHIVVGHGGDTVKHRLNHYAVNWITQAQQLGTGHAVAQAVSHIDESDVVLILYGDVPLIQTKTLHDLLIAAKQSGFALLTVALADATGYGRIVRDANQNITAIVEHKDAAPEQLAIKEINTGIMAVKTEKLKQWLPKLSNDNAQGEYYLTDIVAMAVADGMTVNGVHPSCEQEVQGVNNRVQLAELERWFQYEQAKQLMLAGATVADPNRLDVRGDVSVGQDVFIDVNVVFEGAVTIGDNVVIGPNCVIADSVIADNAVIKANSILESAEVGSAAEVGPFARLRPATVLAKKAKVGNFVETKKVNVGVGSKINHLTYVGDADIGSGVNIGAGTITCNYDGVNKHKTVIEDNVFIGSNSSLVAPVTIAQGATVGAGSTITRAVSAEQLAVSRGKQTNIDGWQRPKKK
ncbi:bifunctional UDP-N-acetylglucosamine diphosphorylase/glucosamine-1-phosphate N-acetyltransferase GlmU [Zooshikella harenae]|uniref:Bifunctional protein GlmU n=1 Tax=Zooshikella harenae TaxID=2827238 RepID=A0ABS5ZK24_9GAMM|nr:bifunctional UDP-N-acetylglucosamine diphosphorylase/glucosamine-1-phosphate N-acetyltransferase GlmU [Zooshikella harenae]MBU2713580.1 bifunctional UDP-N-acetylglucosamine diphosphorylase/glucosamine-1-phosphate N-acetyltransferase GlmU [Zooshikella harenae]